MDREWSSLSPKMWFCPLLSSLATFYKTEDGSQFFLEKFLTLGAKGLRKIHESQYLNFIGCKASTLLDDTSLMSNEIFAKRQLDVSKATRKNKH